MQADLEKEHPGIAISLLAINAEGYESGMPDIAKVGDLPVLQDTKKAGVWDRWGAEWRDVIVLNGDNEVVAVYNLTTYDLSDPDHYAELEALLVGAAE